MLRENSQEKTSKETTVERADEIFNEKVKLYKIYIAARYCDQNWNSVGLH